MTIDLKQFTKNCTLHGVSDLYYTKSISGRIVWAILIMTATACAIYGCHGILDHYRRSPLYVNYIIRASTGRHTPDVVVCPFNRLDLEFVNKHNISVALSEHIQLAYAMKTPYIFQQAQARKILHNQSNVNQLNKLLSDNNWTFSELLDLASTPCNVIVQYCYLPANNIFYNCCDKADPLMTTIGRCYRLSGTRQMSSGFGFGLTIVMSAARDRYMTSLSNLHNDGVSVRLAEPGKAIGQDFTFIPNGVHALMPLRSTLYKFINMPPKYSCVEDDSDYHHQMCFDECVFDEAEVLCNCSHATTSTVKFPACTPTQMYGCLLRTAYVHAQKVFNETRQSVFRVCREKCKPPCEYWEYSPTVSYTKLMGSDLAGHLEFPSLENYVVLDVFYERLEHAVIKHVKSLSTDQFISHVGGQLGLWVGASILTLAQVIVYLVSLLREKVTLTGQIKSPVDNAEHVNGQCVKWTGDCSSNEHNDTQNASMLKQPFDNEEVL